MEYARPSTQGLTYQKWFRKNDSHESFIWVLTARIHGGDTCIYLIPGVEEKGHYVMEYFYLKQNYYRDLVEMEEEERFKRNLQAYSKFVDQMENPKS